MPSRCAIIDRVMLVRWDTVITAQDVTALDDLMTQARAAAAAGPWFHLTLLPQGVELPSVEVQRPLIKRVLKMKLLCGSMHCILEGSGIKEKLGRRFLAGMVRVFGLGQQAFVHATAPQALSQLQPQLGQPAAAIEEQARALGLM